jgi:hypothetical protein
MPSILRPLFTTVAITAAAGVFVASAAHAATIPAKIVRFTPAKPIKTLQVRATSWRDPAFGDMGWTHNSAWGRFTAQAGEIITITANSGNPEVHPGISVWYRGKDDTAPNTYVADHFYPQNVDQVVFGARDETTNEDIGDIVMTIVAYGYDQDGNTEEVPLHGKTDGIPGRLRLTFRAKETGVYLFVLGGFNPGASIDPTVLNDVKTKVRATAP